MATTRLECYPSDAYPEFDVRQTIVGGADLWHDDSDDTYVHLAIPPAVSGVAARVFEVDDLAGVSPAEVTAIRFHMRAEAVPNAFPTVAVSGTFHSHAEGDPGVSAIRGRATLPVLTRGPYLGSMLLFDADGDTQTPGGSDLAAMLVSGAAYGRVAINEFGEQATIFEMWLEVDHDAVAPTIRRRNYPRDDRRNWPRPKAYERGSRRAGGYL